MDEIKNKEIIGKSTESPMGKQIDLKRNTKLKEPISQKIIRNTIFNTIGRFWGILVALFLTPYIIGHIGVDRFGIWAIVGVLTGYFGLLDFGIGTSFVKYISEFYAKEDYEKINQVVNTGFIFYSIFAASIITLGFFIINPLLNFFNIPSNLYSEASFVFFLGIILFSISNALSVFGAVQTGLQRMDITNKVAIAISIPNIAGTILFLERGYGLPGLMVNNAIILAISSIINIIIAFKVLPELRFNPLLVSRSVLKKLFRFGTRVQITRIEDMFTFQTDKLLISHFLGVGLVTYYQLGSTIINRTRQLPLLLISAIVPAASELNAKTDRKKIRDLYLKGTKYLSLIGIPLIMLVFLAAPLIIRIWMGEGYGRSVLVIQILAPCYLINFLTGMGTSIALGMGKPEFQMKAGALQLILNVALSITLVLIIGFIGVVVATLISLSLSSIWFMVMFHRNLRYPLLHFIRKTFSTPLIACLFPAIIIGTLNYSQATFLSNRLANLGILGVETVLFISFYAFVIWKTSYLDKYDKNILTNIASSMRWHKKPATIKSKVKTAVAELTDEKERIDGYRR